MYEDSQNRNDIVPDLVSVDIVKWNPKVMLIFTEQISVTLYIKRTTSMPLC